MNMDHTSIYSLPTRSSYRPSNHHVQCNHWTGPDCSASPPHLRRKQAGMPTKASTRCYNRGLAVFSNAPQGFENLTLDPQTKTLYAMLQSAVIQDGGDAKETAQFTRLFAYNVSNLSVPPPLIGEWVVPLPSSDKGKVLACSEIIFVKPGVFLALSRDGDGRGGDDNNSKYKYVPGNRFFPPLPSRGN